MKRSIVFYLADTACTYDIKPAECHSTMVLFTAKTVSKSDCVSEITLRNSPFISLKRLEC